MRLTSPHFNNNKSIPSRFTCEGENINPRLEIYDVPETAKSLVLIMEDPDATIGIFDHWLIWNMPVDQSGIGENSTPPGIQGVNSAGKNGYIGPCPPTGEHRYFFNLYALDTNISLDRTTGKARLHQAMSGHIVAQTQLIGRYKRSKL
ncbi:MAG: YbhB/YbcL family Raf kinase inhibitor-like protein [Patescibacteria group bacterium]|jgi:hypothetical protein